jgi:hypothetical protein
VTDLDGELEKLRAEARHRLEGERELQEKLAAYEQVDRELRAPPETAPLPDDDEERAATRPVKTAKASLTAKAAEQTAKEAAERVSSLSTPKLVGGLVALIFAAWIIDRLIAPIVAIAVLAVFVILGYRFLRWITSADEDDDDDDDDADKDDPETDTRPS